MEQVKGKSYNELSQLVGNKVHFISDCELFPNFDIICKITNISYRDNLEIIFKVLLHNGKVTDIGSNMKNLMYEIL